MKRLTSIDILRGIALAGMLLVNNPGDWGHIYAPLEHAPFIGLTPTDLVFPTFMFVMGFCIPLSLQKTGFQASLQNIRRILLRTLVIFGVGLFLQWMSSGWCDWSHLRIPGVLQRLAICYGVVAILCLFLKETVLGSMAVIILVIYSFILYFNQGFEFSEANICARVDHLLLGADHLYIDNGVRLDPEGILSTLPSIAHVMFAAVFSMTFLKLKSEQSPQDKAAEEKLFRTFIKTTGAFVITSVLITFLDQIETFPISKKVWSTSFVLITTSIALLLLNGLIWLVDIKKWTGAWSQFFVIFGRNPLLLYIISWIMAHLFGRWGVSWQVYSFFGQYVSAEMASLIYALLFVLFHWLIAFALYKKNVRFRA